MTGFSLKLKSKNGQHVVNDLDAATTIANLKAKVSEVTQIPQSVLHILIGFPPKPLDLSKDLESISSSGVSNGDILIVEERQKEESSPPPAANTYEEDAKLAQHLSAEEENDMGILLKKVVPADNSCLFTSIGYVLNGQVDLDCASYMRLIIAEQVANDPINYSEAILGRPNPEYCEWIKRPESWGGAIEVSILSNFYGLEIDVVDITNAIINRFGEDKNFGLRVFLLFDGIHYDPLYMEPASGGPPRTIFPIEDENVYRQAEQLALEAKASRQFTDVNKFTLRCIQCDSLLVGQVEAQNHAVKTGHTNFGEI
uniref:Ubiquitin thioesterase OTU n=1 Tax=Tabanus bromius TaxID=304241 RepID=A0A0K8TSL9_TABBR